MTARHYNGVAIGIQADEARLVLIALLLTLDLHHLALDLLC